MSEGKGRISGKGEEQGGSCGDSYGNGCGEGCATRAETGIMPARTGEGSSIRHKIMVLSGKGGVGKSSVAACLAIELAESGYRVGLMDVDFHGPSIPVIFGLQGERVGGDERGIHPFIVRDGLKVISIGLFLESRDDAVIWRGPLKMSAIRQFVEEVYWGDIDYLVVDSPPGTGDEPLSVVQLMPDAWALVVTTPQELAAADVRKSVSFCRRTGMRLLGLVENMGVMSCPHCGGEIRIFGKGGAWSIARDMGVEVLAELPFDEGFVAWADRGGARSGSCREIPAVEEAMKVLTEKVVEKTELPKAASGEAVAKEGDLIAVPTEGGVLCSHFGHCEEFTLVGRGKDGELEVKEVCPAPPHQPGLLPRWLAEKGVTAVIAGGMGRSAQNIFSECGIKVVCGATPLPPLQVVEDFLEGRLELGPNACEH